MSLQVNDTVKVRSQNVIGEIVYIHQLQHIVEVRTEDGYQLRVPKSDVVKVAQK